MFLKYQQVDVTTAVKTFADLPSPLPPYGMSGAMLQAETQNVRYTCDNGTNPTSSVGMLLITGLAATEFTFDDMKRIRFILAAGASGKLHIHWFGGREV